MRYDPHMEKWSEQNTYRLFRWSIILKSVDALLQLVGGLLILIIPLQAVVDFVNYVTVDELAENPGNFIMSSLLSWSQHLSMDVKLFAAWYLLSHGIVKGILLLALIKEYLWAYPVSIVVFGAFFIYQVYLLIFKTHSVFLLALTLFNILFIWLIYHEYRLRQAFAARRAS
jgi:uncharacterized membrane protein